MDNWATRSQSGHVAYTGAAGIGNAQRRSSNWGDYYGGYGQREAADSNRGRSQSLTPERHLQWDDSRRQSAPIRWHPQYSQSPTPVEPTPPNWAVTSLETIHEDGTRYNRNYLRNGWNPTNVSLSPKRYRKANEKERRFSNHELTTMSQGSPIKLGLSHGKSTSEGSLYRIGEEDMRSENGATPRGDVGKKNMNLKNDSDNTKRRKKSAISFDANSEKDIRNKISDVRSVKSSRSNISSRAKNSNRFDNTASNSPREPRTPTSRGSRSTTTSRDINTQSVIGSRKKSSSSRMSDASYLPRSKSNASIAASESEGATRVTFAESPLDIPPELLDLRRTSWKRVLRPIVVTILVSLLVVSLFVAIYFAGALKDTQDRHIEFLQATLEFSLSQNQRSRDFSSLTASERQQLKLAYCRQVDAWYRGSSLTDEYRGCQLDLLTNERIEFTLYFLDESGPSKGEGEIMSILANRAQQENQEGGNLVKISDVTLDLSPSRSTVDLAVISKPRDFVVANVETGDNEEETIIKTATIGPTTMDMLTTTTTTTTTRGPPTITTAVNKLRSLDGTVLSDEICQSIRLSEVIAHPFSCGHFIQCEFGTPIARPCSGGLVFDPAGSACVKPRDDLPCREIQPCDNVNGGHFAHPTDCRLFEICDQGKAVMLSCPPGLIWDTISQNCVLRKRGTQCEPLSS